MAQTSQTETRLTLAHTARVIGISTKTSYRWLVSGAFGKTHGKRPVMISIAAIEAAIGPVDPKRIERTRRNTATPGRPKKARHGES